jgi:FlaA1/EpsC-like NDP-sugar epimerase
MLQSNIESAYRPVGFIDDNMDCSHHNLLGLDIYPYNQDLIALMKQKGIKCVIVSPMKMKEINPLKDLAIFLNNDIQILTTPYFTDFSDNVVEDNISKVIGRIESIKVEDLLERPVIDIDTENVNAILSNRIIMVTGAAGSIGSEIVRQVSTYKPKQLILIDNTETPMHNVRIYMASNYPEIETHTIVTSICNKSRMEAVFEKFSPEYVFHAAAYKHVPMMEDNPSEAVQNNIYGTRVIADMSVKYQAKKFVMVSTDKAVNPTNVMGCSKRICEIYVQSLDKAIKEGRINGCTRFVTTRFGNVLGSNGSVIPLFREQIKHGGPITVTHPDIIRYFMLIPEACKLVLQAGTMGNGGEIYIFDMGKPVRIVDLAKRMIKLSGAKNVEIKFSGLRDGEKLYEELLNDTEITKPTHHPKIKIAAVREYDYEDAKRNEDELHELSFTYDKMAVVKKMKEIVPEFKSKHSVYEVLDT